MSANDASSARLLIIDEDPVAAASAVALLRPLGETVVVTAASYALERLSLGERFDVIVCEAGLRRMNGADFFRRVRHFYPDAALGTIFVAKADAKEAWSQVALLARPCVAKPYADDALLGAARHILTSVRGVRVISPLAVTLASFRTAETPVPEDEPPITVRAKEATFGPFYPAPLQAVVLHLERLAHAIDRRFDEILESPAFDPDNPTLAELWLQGRADEIEAFVADIIADWRGRELSPELAATVLERYVEALHRGMLANVTHGRPVACCGMSEPPNPPSPKPEAVTRPRPPRHFGDTPSTLRNL